MSEDRLAEQDVRNDMRVLIGTVVVVFLAFGIGTVPQAAFQAAVNTGNPDVSLTAIAGDILQRMLLNLVILAAALVTMVVIRPLRHSRPRLLADAFIIAVVAGILRALLQMLRGAYEIDEWRTALVESGTVALLAFVMVGAGFEHVSARRRIRVQERASARQSVIAAAALDALATEELRVRRDVAEGLHGTVQQNLVLLGMRVEAIGSRLEASGRTEPDELAELRGIRETIDRIRETDVRTLSQLLYPVGIELGAVAALRLLLQRLPGTIASSVHIDDAVLDLEGNGRTALTIERRLLLVRIAEEALSNALRHGRATAVRLELLLVDGVIEMTFDDDGYGLGPAPTPSGLARFRERLIPLGGSVDFGDDSPLGGTRLRALLPVGASARVGQPVPQL